LLSFVGFNTPSLPAQGEQRLPHNFNNGRDIPAFDATEAQALSDKAVEVLRAASAGELPPRMVTDPDFYLCRWCEYAGRCWGARS
jgi:hypothetical protein